MLLATTSLAANTVESVEVTADLTAIENVETAQVWGDLSPDLETLIAERLAAQIAEDGASITLDIDEVSLANMFTQATGKAQSRLAGDIESTHPACSTRSTTLSA